MTKAARDVTVQSFEDVAALDAWLTAQPAGARGIWLKIAKAKSGVASLT